MESAEESRAKFGAKLAFDDWRKMLEHPDIDAVAVVLRVPSHYEPTMAALDAGKHVYTEWPLGRTTAEAQEMAELARSRGVRNMVGLQARAAPPLLYARDLVASGYVGEVMSCHVSRIQGGVLERTSDRSWQRDKEMGANTLTITCGHTIDALRFVVGDFSQVSAVVSTQAEEWLEVDTGQRVGVTSPDNILVSGRLTNGGVASVHVSSNPWAGSGYRMEIHGRDGTLVVTSEESPNHDGMRLQGARGGNVLEDLAAPSKYTFVLEGMPRGAPTMWARCTTSLARGFALEKIASQTSTPQWSCTAFSISSRKHRSRDRSCGYKEECSIHLGISQPLPWVSRVMEAVSKIGTIRCHGVRG
jgi:predicted dehydrogenase